MRSTSRCSSAGDRATGPCHSQWPSTATRRCAARSPSTRCRSHSTLPRVVSWSRRWVWASSGPPRAAPSSSAASSGASGSISRRSPTPSFQIAVIASGHGSPVRTVRTSRTACSTASWWTSVAETSSSMCASSTSSSMRGPSARSAAPTRARAETAPASSSAFSQGANAPRGTSRDDADAVATATVSSVAARATSSRANRLLPTPAAPATTTRPSRSRSDATARSSASRPVKGQDRTGAGRAGRGTTVLRGRSGGVRKSAPAGPNV